ncbi:MAG TPA: hypothetical protein VF763_03120 [Candidatus Limnocylindrales bacterium]
MARRAPSLPPLRYLAAAEVEAAMPDLPERLALAERTMLALASGAGELPAKIGVHPRPEASFAHAMPAFLRGDAGDGSGDLLGIKWVSGVPANVERGLPAIHGLLVVNDPRSGVPIALLDAGPITAQRTAAVSGVAIARFAPRAATDRPPRAALLGAGVQGRSHLPVLAALLPRVELAVFDADPARAAALAEVAGATAGIAAARVAADPVHALAGAGVVVTTAAFGPRHGLLQLDALDAAALVVAVDYDTYASAALARGADLFLTDDRGQFDATRAGGTFFAGFPDPAATLGEVLAAPARWPRPRGRVLVCHLGVGLADLVFGAAILRGAERRGLGTLLER